MFYFPLILLTNVLTFQGVLSMSVSDILAQAPLLLSTVLSKQKNMGQPPLVPFFTTIKPLETGDIVIEVCH